MRLVIIAAVLLTAACERKPANSIPEPTPSPTASPAVGAAPGPA